MFRAVPLPIIRSFPLYIRHWYMSCTFDDRAQARPGWTYLCVVIKIAWHIPVPNVQWKTPDDGQRNCPKHVEFFDKNKFGKNSESVGFIKKKREVIFTALHINITKVIFMNLPWGGGGGFTMNIGLYSLRNITNHLFQDDIGKTINGGNMFV